MKTDTVQMRTCPLCGCIYSEPPAISRVNNNTLICPDCGTREALESIGIGVEEQDKILKSIHMARI